MQSEQPAPLRTAPLPPRPPLLAALGPGVVWLALAQGSGELVWWPFVVAKYGLGLLFLLVPACLLQWPLNVEIGRYTILTGESVWQGFVRLHRGFALALWILMAASFFWFGGFAAAGGEAVAALTGVGTKLTWGYATVGVFFFSLLFSRVAYVLIERVMGAVAVITVGGLVLACLHPDVRAAAPRFALGLAGAGGTFLDLARPWDAADATKLLAAVTFAGLGGFWTLFYSSWLREKGAGMGGRIGRVTSPVTGRAEPIDDVGYAPADEPDLRAKSRSWMRFLWLDAGIGVFGNLATTIMTCLLAYALLLPRGEIPSEGSLVTYQAAFFRASWGAWGGALFLVVAAAFLADTWLATVDAVAHTHTEMTRAFVPAVARRWDYRSTYYAWVVVLTVVTCATMALRPPGVLILYSAVIGFVGTVIYAAALVALNYRLVPKMVPAAAAPDRRGACLLGGVAAVYAALACAYIWLRFVA